VNYSEQQKYLKRSRIWSAVCVLVTIPVAVYAWKSSGITARTPVIVFALAIAGLAGSFFYTPDYLHLNVNRTKRMRWQIKIRWRLIGIGMLIGVVSDTTARHLEIALVSCAWLALANVLSKQATSPRFSSLYFWITDAVLLGTLLATTHVDVLSAATLILTATHLAVVTIEQAAQGLPVVFTIAISQVIFRVGQRGQVVWNTSPASAAVIIVAVFAAGMLVIRSQKQNTKNFVAAKLELKEFTGYSDDKVRKLWATSNEQLAKNWKDAHLDESDREKMTAWYRENSELYMFAISGYNLEYKRIRDNIKMLKFGRGACLDYGAGNGEIILELARRGHAATYFDVDGTSMKFAQMRAERQKLVVKFVHTKPDLQATAQQHGLDTIFSFDVLEHLPDLPGELKFLSSLLNPGGLLVFDVPAGSTKSHPMHLNHHLDIHAHMKSIGMVEERSVWQSIPFRKQEKYVYRKSI
jgi:2-polyprenyl-3-methyl-5-hydroxy-6-metoxy-1,4-benzoquinol methylase